MLTPKKDSLLQISHLDALQLGKIRICSLCDGDLDEYLVPVHLHLDAPVGPLVVELGFVLEPELFNNHYSHKYVLISKSYCAVFFAPEGPEQKQLLGVFDDGEVAGSLQLGQVGEMAVFRQKLAGRIALRKEGILEGFAEIVDGHFAPVFMGNVLVDFWQQCFDQVVGFLCFIRGVFSMRNETTLLDRLESQSFTCSFIVYLSKALFKRV